MIEQFIKNLEATQNQKFTEQEKQAIKIAIEDLLNNPWSPLSDKITAANQKFYLAEDIKLILEENYDIDAEIPPATLALVISKYHKNEGNWDALAEMRNDLIDQSLSSVITKNNPIYDTKTGNEYAWCSWCKELYSTNELDDNGYCSKCNRAIKSRGEIMK